jgi:hypothetical protein
VVVEEDARLSPFQQEKLGLTSQGLEDPQVKSLSLYTYRFQQCFAFICFIIRRRNWEIVCKLKQKIKKTWIYVSTPPYVPLA